MSLNHYTQPKKKRHVSLKAAIRIMCSKWDEGPRDRFDLKLSRVLDCSLKYASEIREFWVDSGFMAYDRRGLLKWRSGGF